FIEISPEFRLVENSTYEHTDFSGGLPIHFPGNYNQCNKNASGGTIGRGYDMGRRFKSEILSDLRASGVPQNQAEEISKISILQGCRAADFVKKNKSKIGEITEIQQIKLFYITYDKYVKRAIVFYKNSKEVNL
ncbi:hypothetical protein HH682_14595, partial [Rosenbergiella sp. S61]